MWALRHRSLAMAMGAGLGVLVLILVAVIPLYSRVRTMSLKIKTKSAELESLTAKVSILSKLDPNVLQERMTILDSALPPRKDILLYLSSISALSKELGLSFAGLSLSPGELTEATASAKKAIQASGLQSLETEVKMSGGEESIYAFLRTIENVLPLMQIKNIKVSIMGDKEYALSVTLGMLWAEPATADLKGPITLFGAEEDKYFTQLSEYRRFEAVNIAPSDTTEKKADLFAPINLVTPLP